MSGKKTNKVPRRKYKRPCALKIIRAAHTPPLRLSAEFGEKINRFSEFENCKSKEQGGETRRGQRVNLDAKLAKQWSNHKSPIAIRQSLNHPMTRAVTSDE
jgi:hypothetical protein